MQVGQRFLIKNRYHLGWFALDKVYTVRELYGCKYSCPKCSCPITSRFNIESNVGYFICSSKIILL